MVHNIFYKTFDKKFYSYTYIHFSNFQTKNAHFLPYFLEKKEKKQTK